MKHRVIHLTGASGSGTSTLGHVISERFGYTQLDTDDFFWAVKFSEKREAPARQRLLRQAVDSSGRCVISGSLIGWGDMYIPDFDLVIYVYAPTAVRIKRLRRREYERFGERVRPGGDMYDEHLEFLEWAAGYDTGGMEMRSALSHREWLRGVPCRIVRIDGTLPNDTQLELLNL